MCIYKIILFITSTNRSDPHFEFFQKPKKALGYTAYRDAVASHVDNEDRLCRQIDYAGQKRNVTLISKR